jgi:hypothetical protein
LFGFASLEGLFGDYFYCVYAVGLKIFYLEAASESSLAQEAPAGVLADHIATVFVEAFLDDGRIAGGLFL